MRQSKQVIENKTSIREHKHVSTLFRFIIGCPTSVLRATLARYS